VAGVSIATPLGGRSTVVLDANVLIAAMDSANALHARARAAMKTALPRGLALHPLTAAEVLVGAEREGRAAEVEEAVAAAGVTLVSGDSVTPREMAAARAASGLRLPDAIVLATAIRLGGALATFDSQLRAAAASAGVAVLPASQD
jgi:predicted nucleic acid-binding protein